MMTLCSTKGIVVISLIFMVAIGFFVYKYDQEATAKHGNPKLQKVYGWSVAGLTLAWVVVSGSA